MSVRYDDTWELGETWSLIVNCTDLDNQPVSPTAADWKLSQMDGTPVLVMTDPDIAVAGDVCTITVSTGQQIGIEPSVYRHRLKVTSNGGAVSRQIHGLIEVLADE
jgi:hypothetical protein